MTQKRGISRRAVLRGLGTAVALPLMDVMQPAVSLAAGGVSGASVAPTRMAFIFIPNSTLR